MDVTGRCCNEKGRILNSVLHANGWPLPPVDEIRNYMRGSSVFTTIDLFQGYSLVKIDESCKEKAAFICRYENFQFEVMPFGLSNSQAIFQRNIGRVFLKVDDVRCYVDHLVIVPETTRSTRST